MITFLFFHAQSAPSAKQKDAKSEDKRDDGRELIPLGLLKAIDQGTHDVLWFCFLKSIIGIIDLMFIFFKFLLGLNFFIAA